MRMNKRRFTDGCDEYNAAYEAARRRAQKFCKGLTRAQLKLVLLVWQRRGGTEGLTHDSIAHCVVISELLRG